MEQIRTNEKKIVFHITYNPVELKEVDPVLSALTIAHLDTIVSFQGPGISWSFPLRAIKSMQIEVFPESSTVPTPDHSKASEDKQMKLFDESTPSIPIYNLDV